MNILRISYQKKSKEHCWSKFTTRRYPVPYVVLNGPSQQVLYSVPITLINTLEFLWTLQYIFLHDNKLSGFSKPLVLKKNTSFKYFGSRSNDKLCNPQEQTYQRSIDKIFAQSWRSSAQDRHPSSSIGVDEQHKKGFKRFPRFWQFNLCRKIE